MKRIKDSNRRRILNAKLNQICDQIGIEEADRPRLLVTTQEVRNLPKEWDIYGRTIVNRYLEYHWKQYHIIFLNLRKMRNIIEATNNLIKGLIAYRWPDMSYREREKRYKFVKEGKRYETQAEQDRKRVVWEKANPEKVAERERKKKERAEQRQREYDEWKKKWDEDAPERERKKREAEQERQRQEEERQQREQERMERESKYYPWSLLQIPAGSTKDVIKAAYKRLCLILHPDRNPPEKKTWAHNKFIELTRAYEHAMRWHY